MGSRKQGNSIKPQYIKVKAKKRKGGGNSAAMARRALTVGLGLLVLVFGVMGLVKGFGWINRSLYAENPAFEIQHLDISSDGSLTEDLIREYAQIGEGMNLFAFDFKEIEERLMSPVVESVYLERKLPHTLVIRVKERTPMARIMGAHDVRYPNMIDEFGHVMIYKGKYAALPVIKGVDGDLRPGTVVNDLGVAVSLEILGECRAHPNYQQYLQVLSFDVSEGDYIEMYLQADARKTTRVMMPRYSVKSKVSTLVATIQTGLSRGELYRKIDMTLDVEKAPVEPY